MTSQAAACHHTMYSLCVVLETGWPRHNSVPCIQTDEGGTHFHNGMNKVGTLGCEQTWHSVVVTDLALCGVNKVVSLGCEQSWHYSSCC